VRDTVGVAGGEILRIHALAKSELAGERPLRPLGGNDLLAVAIVRGARGPDRQDAVLDGHLDAVRVGAGQVGLDMVAAVLAAVRGRRLSACRAGDASRSRPWTTAAQKDP
jgi:hypothetical protein